MHIGFLGISAETLEKIIKENFENCLKNYQNLLYCSKNNITNFVYIVYLSELGKFRLNNL